MYYRDRYVLEVDPFNLSGMLHDEGYLDYYPTLSTEGAAQDLFIETEKLLGWHDYEPRSKERSYHFRARGPRGCHVLRALGGWIPEPQSARHAPREPRGWLVRASKLLSEV